MGAICASITLYVRKQAVSLERKHLTHAALIPILEPGDLRPAHEAGVAGFEAVAVRSAQALSCSERTQRPMP